MADNTKDSSQAKAKKAWYKKWWVWVIAVVLVIAIASTSGSQEKKASSGGEKPAETTAKAETASIGQAARDGDFEFKVNSISCGEATMGDNPYLQKTAQGQYCRLNLSITNIGDKAQGLFSNDQKLVDAQGKQYSADDMATLYAAPAGSTATWFNDINPGNTVSGEIIFDVPQGVTPVTAELHDSAFSGGVKVNLQ